MNLTLRQAALADLPALGRLIDASVRGLQAEDYTAEQIESALRTVFTVDLQLIEDGSFFVVEQEGEMVGCGGWSRRKTLCGGSCHAMRDDALLNPERDAAKIRAIFVHPSQARKGIGNLLLKAAEDAAISAGFARLEMGATLTGVPMYLRKGYRAIERIEVPLENGASMPVVRMEKTIPRSSNPRPALSSDAEIR